MSSVDYSDYDSDYEDEQYGIEEQRKFDRILRNKE